MYVCVLNFALSITQIRTNWRLFNLEMGNSELGWVRKVTQKE